MKALEHKDVMMNKELLDFQRDIVSWAIKHGRAAIWADCGLGKTKQNRRRKGQ